MYAKINCFVLSAILILCACKKDPIAEYDDSPYTIVFSNNNLPSPNLPADNPLTVQKVALGKMLFYEKAMSKDGSMACATCHLQEDGFSDANQFSEGVEGLLGKRQAMAIFNLAWHENGFFWDGRAELLREQSILPIQDPLEMNESMENVVSKLSSNKEYKNQFIRAFGNDEITSLKISLALEAFMLTIISDNSKYDQYLAGTATLTESEERGRILFFGEYNEFFPATSGADCAHCHSGNNFENDLYMNNGLDTDAEFIDFGREDATANIEDRAKFKVPSLRNIALTAPYMHDGRFNTLEEVIEHYNNNIEHSSTLAPELTATIGTGLMLDPGEIVDLVNFLKTFTDPTYLSNPAYKSPF